ncbi:hypothetical protein [Rhodococcus opacus]|uniref:Uncharacterized protein n=1 Tax=Rhodococcus opacus (strain B4) TaxID=632772 RepID=C1B3Z1_RHOOB|nr:hypothetical protein [Rhodococcus opacus]BAH50839.1 hypothetical protein ROP_25920 [Rhodococcus opacus B4]
MAVQATIDPVGVNVSKSVFSIDGKQFTVETSANVPLDRTGTPWLPPGVVVAMTTEQDLVLDTPVDPAALSGAEQARDLLRSWYPQLGTSSVVAPVTSPAAREGGGVGCFFSGGLDAFYSVLKNRAEITHLILVHGFDIDPRRPKPYERISAGARDVAAEMGVELIEIRTDLQFLHTKHGNNWASTAHGAALAHVALLLSPHLRKVIVAASGSYDTGTLDPHGSHPDLDPLWSSGSVEIVQDGTEAGRVDKAEAIKDSDLAMRHLRVCNLASDSEYNCGKCEKCIRTMINLYIAGGLERCETLPHTIPIERMNRMHVRSGAFPFATENLEAMRARGIHDAELEAALQRILERTPRQQRILAYRWLLVEVAPRLPRVLIGLLVQRVRAMRSAPVSTC